MLKLLGAAQQPALGVAEALFSRFRPAPKPIVLPQGGCTSLISR